ncbi:MAG: NUDIX domain-containing protein [Nanoarchaeota archaeon]|nr:NUDIX domain-containing protein [Nanoarchaeota archaeon]
MRLGVYSSIIQDKKILIVKKKETWILPGGKPEANEGDLECLCREVEEELSGTKISNQRFYREFEGQTPHAGDMLKARVYFADLQGPLHIFSKEILGVAWISSNEIGNYNLSDITRKVLDDLNRENYI